MPTYEYRCPKGHEFELFQRRSDEPRTACPECAEIAERLLSGGAGLIFKGEGFYITDYRSDEYKKAASSDKEAASEGGSSEGAGSSSEQVNSSGGGGSGSDGGSSESKGASSDSSTASGGSKASGGEKSSSSDAGPGPNG